MNIKPALSEPRSELLTLNEYDAAARRTDQLVESSGLGYPLLGLFGETGSLLSEVKKQQRDPIAYLGYEASVLEELGDVLWYLVAVARRAGLSLADLAVNLDSELMDWKQETPERLTFSEIEIVSDTPKTGPTPTFEQASLRLAAEVGLLMTDYRSGRLDHNRSALKGRLIAVLRALRVAAHDAGLSLGIAASANITKINDRWPDDRKFPKLFDVDFPSHEQLPRKASIQIEEVFVGDRGAAKLSINGNPIGDPLTDNREDDDDYRFHDVFHLSYAAHLGWSPTLRRLLKVKRKSDALIDEVQDGARAILIEEGIATWIFNHAQKLSLFQDIDRLDYGLLKSVRDFVKGYESDVLPLWLWEDAILNGYKVFREVRKHRKGLISIDLDQRSIKFEI